VLPSSPCAVLAIALLAGAAKVAESAPLSRCAATARFDLAAESPEGAPDVCVSADEPTTFVFDSRVGVGAVEFQPEGRLADWAQGKEGLSLHVIPKGNYLPGERVRVTVRFADDTVPASASFWLVGHALKGTRRVEVFRQPRPPDVLKKERDEAQAEARQCQEDKARLLAEREEPSRLMGAAWLERAGSIESKKLGALRDHPANALWLVEAWSYSYTLAGMAHPASVAVWLKLKNPGAEPWKVAGAALVDSIGEEVALAAWQVVPIPQGPAGGFVVVGAERAPEQFGCPCTLKLWEAGGPRTVTLGNVTFPVSQKAEP